MTAENKSFSQMPGASPASATDIIPILRSGDNFTLTIEDVNLFTRQNILSGGGGSNRQLTFSDGGTISTDIRLTYIDDAVVGTGIALTNNDGTDPDGNIWFGCDPIYGDLIGVYGANPTLEAWCYTDDTSLMQYYHGGWLSLVRSRGTVASPQDVQAGDDVGTIMFSGKYLDTNGQTAAIWAQVETLGTYIGGELYFGTKPATSSNPLPRMRIAADGGVLLRASLSTDPAGGSHGPGTINIDGSGGYHFKGVAANGATTVGALPAAASNAYARTFVTDSNATHTAGIGAIVAAGGANIVPVYSDGTNWRIG